MSESNAEKPESRCPTTGLTDEESAEYVALQQLHDSNSEMTERERKDLRNFQSRIANFQEAKGIEPNAKKMVAFQNLSDLNDLDEHEKDQYLDGIERSQQSSRRAIARKLRKPNEEKPL